VSAEGHRQGLQILTHRAVFIEEDRDFAAGGRGWTRTTPWGDGDALAVVKPTVVASSRARHPRSSRRAGLAVHGRGFRIRLLF
jgi:hypothetical protein